MLWVKSCLAPGWLLACGLVSWPFLGTWLGTCQVRLGPAWWIGWVIGLFAWTSICPSEGADSTFDAAGGDLWSRGRLDRYWHLAGAAALVAATMLVMAGNICHRVPVWWAGMGLGMVGLGVMTLGPRGIVHSLLLMPFLLAMIGWPERLEVLVGPRAGQVVVLVTSSTLQFLGVPAIQDGNSVWVWERSLAFTGTYLTVGRLVGIGLLVWAYTICSSSSIISRACVLMMAAPIAVVTVSLQLVVAALGGHYLAPDVMALAETWLGVLSIPIALAWAMFVDWYVGKLVSSADPIPMCELVSVGRESSSAATALAAAKR